ncbi:MAG: endolytic transglycosylase MltG [Chloroflexi bacterium]|nr:MAG: endolytic transglycosylase MltG [Chloroflexota bacterium]
MATRPARPAPRARSAAGPLMFIVVVVALLIGAIVVGRPVAEDAIVAQVQEHDTLLKQAVIRALIADRVGAEPDLAKDPLAESRSFVISRGETAGSIAQRLQSEGFIRSALAFSYVLYDTGRETSLQSGTYTISASLTPRDLARVFEKAPGEQAVLRIIEGWRLSETAAAVHKAFPSITVEEFTKAAVVGQRRNTVLAGLSPDTSLEGFLFPDTYFFKPSATAAQIIDALLDQFEQRVGQTLRRAAAERKLTIYEIVKLGSIVEREARDRQESATIAGVYINRLEIGMKLDADPTVQYAVGEWREPTAADLESDSPYNTYKVAGLPPTPICSPGQAAIEGAARPADVPYFYFVAKNDGTGDHAFAKTLEEHEANRVKYGNK